MAPPIGMGIVMARTGGHDPTRLRCRTLVYADFWTLAASASQSSNPLITFGNNRATAFRNSNDAAQNSRSDGLMVRLQYRP